LELVEVAEGFDYQTLHGSHKAVTLPSPAAGAALTYTVPGSVQWEILSLSFTYTASGNAASRVPFVRFLDQSGTAFCDVATPYKLVASDVSRVTFGVGVVRIGAGIPAMRLEDGLRVQVSATLIDGSDTITLARLFVRQWDVRE
jgi:hypothetical protein